MELNINDLSKLNKYKKIFIVTELQNNNIKNDHNICTLILKNILNELDAKCKDEKKNIFYLSFKEYKKNWQLRSILRIKTFKKFKEFYKKSKFCKYFLIKFFKFIYKSDKYEYSLKKYLLLDYEKFQELKYLIELIKKNNPTAEITLDQKLQKLFYIYEDRTKLKNYFDLDRLKKIFIILFYPLIIIFNNKIVFSNKKKYFKNFYRIYKNGFGVGDLGNLDWLIKDKKNSIFVIEDYLPSNSPHILSLKKNNYLFTFCNNRKIDKINFLTLLRLVFFTTPFSILIGILIFFSKPILFNFYYSSWLNLLKWKIFLKNYNGENYVVYHNYQYDHILRNILLNSKFIKTIHYKHTNTENIFNYKIKHKKNYINNDQLYLFYNYEFHQTKQSIVMAKSNKSLSENHLISGPTFMDPKTIVDNPIKYNLIFFNSSLMSDRPLNIHISHSIFLDLIIKMSENQNLKILFKSKFNVKHYENYNSDLKNKILKLRNKKNVDILDTNYNYNLYKLVNNDQISILMPFASPCIVFLANKNKFFFVDFLNIFKNSFFSSYENFIKNNLPDSIEHINRLMNVSEHNYSRNISKLYFDTFDTDQDIILKNNLYKFLN